VSALNGCRIGCGIFVGGTMAASGSVQPPGAGVVADDGAGVGPVLCQQRAPPDLAGPVGEPAA
jgi:hypothetical protein